jgi:membrane complex biogenesis BtpA family protein
LKYGNLYWVIIEIKLLFSEFMSIELFKSSHPVIGMVHLPPLPGSPNWNSNLEELDEQTLADFNALYKGGVHGILIENFGDVPFTKNKVHPLTVSMITRVITNCKAKHNIPIGINVLRNDWEAALSIAAATDASFIRINILSGAFATDQGIIEGNAYECLRFRRQLERELDRKILIFADVNTKHATPLHQQTLAATTDDLVKRIGPDGLIVTGSSTGIPPDEKDVKEVKEHSGGIPVFVGSGLNPGNIKKYVIHATGFIVGTYFKKNGHIKNMVDPLRVATLMKKI